MHESMPDVASEPAKAIPTGWLNQPFASAARLGDAPVTVGASVSILNCRWNGIDALPSVAVQSSTSPTALNVFAAGQVVSVAPCTEIWTVTALRYQPLSPAVPDVTE